MAQMSAVSQTVVMRVVRLYVLLLCGGFFVWPVSLGVPAGPLRVVWILIATLCLLLSIHAALNAARRGESVHINREPFPFWLYGLAVLPVLVAGATMPLAVFGDEEAMLLPALTVLSMFARLSGWIVLMAAALVTLYAGALFVRRFPERFFSVFIGCCGLLALAVALFVTRTETEFVRYPPLVHFMQGFATVFTAGEPMLFRLPSVLWLFLFGWMLWYVAPWPRTARFLAFITVMLTPLGLVYRVLLYQSAGEIVFAAMAALLMAQFIAARIKVGSTPLLGMTFTLWIMYRPTALAVAVACCILLLLLGYRRAAKDIALIAFPIGLMWVLIYYIGSFQYDFLQPGAGRVWSLESFIAPVRETLRMLPAQLHPAGIVLVLTGSVWLFWKERNRAMALMIVWYIALINTAVHQLLTTEKWYGYGRFNALLILPLAFTSGLLWRNITTRQVLTGVALIILALVTPWHLSRFMQALRATPPDHVERTVTGGMTPIPLPHVVEALLQRGIKPAVIIAPSYAFLDISIARGLLTPAERTMIREQSKAWVLGDMQRPVVVQAPLDPLHYLGNLSVEEEQKLRDAAEWAKVQSGVTVVMYGKEVTYVVH